jgi:hypothetical protein
MAAPTQSQPATNFELDANQRLPLRVSQDLKRKPVAVAGMAMEQ